MTVADAASGSAWAAREPAGAAGLQAAPAGLRHGRGHRDDPVRPGRHRVGHRGRGDFVGLDNYTRALSNPALAESVKQTAIYAADRAADRDPARAGPCPARSPDHPIGRASRRRSMCWPSSLSSSPVSPPASSSAWSTPPTTDSSTSSSSSSSPSRTRSCGCLSPPLGDALRGQRRHLAMDAVRVPGHVRRPPDGAARIGRGGAGGRRDLWTQFRHIELPYLRPLLLLVLFFRIADVLRVFDHVYVLTGGGPGRRPSS